MDYGNVASFVAGCVLFCFVSHTWIIGAGLHPLYNRMAVRRCRCQRQQPMKRLRVAHLAYGVSSVFTPTYFHHVSILFHHVSIMLQSCFQHGPSCFHQFPIMFPSCCNQRATGVHRSQCGSSSTSKGTRSSGNPSSGQTRMRMAGQWWRPVNPFRKGQLWPMRTEASRRYWQTGHLACGRFREGGG